MEPTRRFFAAALFGLFAAGTAQAQELGAAQRTGRAVDRGAQRTGNAVTRGARRTGAAAQRAGNWTAERARRARRRVAGGN